MPSTILPTIYHEKNDLDQLRTVLHQEFEKSKKVILVDENTHEHCLPLLLRTLPELEDAEILGVRDGDSAKSIEMCMELWTSLTNLNINRNDVFINLGGGVVSDIGGFVAATYKRGMNYINVPTTLLAQVDASIGGKTGVNFSHFKNLIGAIYQPHSIFIYPTFLKTLPLKQVYSGYAEMIKAALIGDKKLWDHLVDIEQLTLDKLVSLIPISVGIKSTIVEKDPLEKNIRKTLNFGHTIGHAIETYSMNHHRNPCLHGEAVAMGMICETFISFKSGKIDSGKMNAIISFISSHFKKIVFDPAHISSITDSMRKDKKNITDAINFSLLDDIGEACYNIEIEEKIISDSLRYLFHLQH